ncbi:hypothetical protein A3L11_00005 [Thermococcus siculi]|uniref:ATPase AAA-3 domain-containing protein n=1 Tax=Thermococcus siculi TaxID=72803 RepID=A0A2Z2N035_9EURY|nr:hypothetical protein A3L11_00005 [Thermococcus siculi]
MNVKEASKTLEGIVEEISSVYIGNEVVVRKTLAAALVNGNVLFEDYPGLGKTLLAKAFGRVLGLKYTRVQFTPDLLPADILGTKVWRQNLGTLTGKPSWGYRIWLSRVFTWIGVFSSTLWAWSGMRGVTRGLRLGRVRAGQLP